MTSADQKLVMWARQQVGKPFEWGVTDCAMLALQAVDILTDGEHAQTYAGKWETQSQALAHFEIEKPSDVLQRLGAVEIDAIRAAAGDILTLPAYIWPEQLHVVMGRLCLSADIDQGVCLLPTRLFVTVEGARAWRFC